MIIKRKQISFFMLFLYLVANFAHKRLTSFDTLFVRATFILLISSVFMLHKKIKFTHGLKWVFAFWGLYFVSIMWGHNILDSFKYINDAIQIIGLMICIPMLIEDKEDIELLLKYIIVAMIYASVLLIIRTPATSWGTERVGAVIGIHPNVLGRQAAFSAAICLYFIHNDGTLFGIKNQRLKIMICILMIIVFGIIGMMTGSKLSLFMILFCVFFYEIAITKDRKLVFKALFLMLLLVAVVYVLFNNEMIYSILGKRVERLIWSLQGRTVAGVIDVSFNERKFFINEAKRLFFQYPILGYGANNFMSFMREE